MNHPIPPEAGNSMTKMLTTQTYRDKKKIGEILEMIRKRSSKKIRLMEVCGGHTMAIHKFGIPGLLPKNVILKSGPGCPVCVSDQKFIDRAIAIARKEDVILTTFGDLIRVPGSTSSLEKERAKGCDIRIVYSSLDALKIARQNPEKRVVFLGIGFETTAPTSAATILKASKSKIDNFCLLSAHKIMPPAMEALAFDGIRIDGFIGPGHVSTITGSGIYQILADNHGIGCVISGFEPVDILQSILMLINQKEQGEPKVEIEYSRAVKPKGNEKAQRIMEEVFYLSDDCWRGFGDIPMSGLKIRKKYARWDAEKVLHVTVEKTRYKKGCICGEVLKGKKSPTECRLFKSACTPATPIGACMVSSEGACHAHYLYGNGKLL